MEHSPFGPSSIKRRILCPGSYHAELDLPEKTSEYAAEGSAAHHLAELCLKDGKNAEEFLGCTFDKYPNFPVTVEMADNVQIYVDYVRDLGGQQEYEQKVSYDEYIADGFGTADAIVINETTIHVIDFKYGMGVKVYAEENPQGQLYALGALLERSFENFERVLIHIVQPRLEHVDIWETTPDAIYKFAEYASEKVKLCLEENPKRIPGTEQCQWCKALATCPAVAQRTENALLVQFDDLQTSQPPASEVLDDSTLKFVLMQKALITQWLKAVEDHVKDQIMSGKEFEGFKIVHGKSTRVWEDEEKAEKKLNSLLGKTKSYTKKILSPAQAEKALGKDNKDKIQDIIIKPLGAPTLVQENDKREAISFVTADDF